MKLDKCHLKLLPQPCRISWFLYHLTLMAPVIVLQVFLEQTCWKRGQRPQWQPCLAESSRDTLSPCTETTYQHSHTPAPSALCALSKGKVHLPTVLCRSQRRFYNFSIWGRNRGDMIELGTPGQVQASCCFCFFALFL